MSQGLRRSGLRRIAILVSAPLLVVGIVPVVLATISASPAAATSTLASPGDITTLDGNGTAGSGPGELHTPTDVIVDAEGNQYVADAGNDRVVELSASADTQWGIAMSAGGTYTILGTGTAGTSGDGGAGTSARLNYPQGLALDVAGDLYVADGANNRIQELAATTHTQRGQAMTTGDVYTVAGSSSGSSGSSGDGGPATSALLHGPYGLAFDGSGNLYIGDEGNERVQFLAAASCSSDCLWGQSVTADDLYTVAGGSPGSAGDGGPATSADLSDPTGVALDAEGDLFVADASNDRVQEVAAASGTEWGIAMTAGDVYTIAGSPTGSSGSSGAGGPTEDLRLNYPTGVATDASGDVFVADGGNNRVLELSARTDLQWGISMHAGAGYVVGGTGTAGFSGDAGATTAAELDDPTAVAHTRRGRRRVLAGVAAAALVLGGVGAYLAEASGGSRAPAVVAAPVGHAPLIALADDLETSATTPQPGDATLVVTDQNSPGEPSVSGADLYTDSGEYFYAPTEAGLPAAIAAGDNQGDAMFAREIEAATAAATGDLAAAAQQMAAAPLDPGSSLPADIAQPLGGGPADAAKKFGESGVIPLDNYVWENSLDALQAGAGNPQVRIGVLRLLSTLAEVTVTDTTTGGRRPLSLTASAPALPAGDHETLVIGARSGIPLVFSAGRSGEAPSVTITYQVSRVTVADLAAGRS